MYFEVFVLVMFTSLFLSMKGAVSNFLKTVHYASFYLTKCGLPLYPRDISNKSKPLLIKNLSSACQAVLHGNYRAVGHLALSSVNNQHFACLTLYNSPCPLKESVSLELFNNPVKLGKSSSSHVGSKLSSRKIQQPEWFFMKNQSLSGRQGLCSAGRRWSAAAGLPQECSL